jgi:hypothetical protein
MSQTLQKVDASLPARALSVGAFEQQLGGREALFEILSQGDSTPEVQILLGLIGDPRNHALSLAHLCRMANLHPGEVFLAYERALQVRARVLARLPIAEALPLVAADAMRRATTHKVLCPDCNGRLKFFRIGKEGVVTEITCQACTDGWVNQEPSLDQQKLALELGELCQKSGLTIQNQQIQDNSKTVNLNMGSTLARLQQVAADAAFSPDATAPTIDGDIVAAGGEPDAL